MKNFMISVLFVLLSGSLPASTGGDAVRTGGDGLVQQFVFEARTAVDLLEDVQLDPQLAELVRILKKNVETVVVHSTDEVLIVDSIIVDAVNDRSLMTILINRDRWKEKGVLKRSEITALILHEYINISGFDDRFYALSHKLIDLIRVKLDMNPHQYFDFLNNLRFARSMKQKLFDVMIKMKNAVDKDRIPVAVDFCKQVREFNLISSRLLAYTYNPMAPTEISTSSRTFVMLDLNAAALTSRCSVSRDFTRDEINYFIETTLRNISFDLDRVPHL